MKTTKRDHPVAGPTFRPGGRPWYTCDECGEAVRAQWPRRGWRHYGKEIAK